jgi:predicted DNA-binding antitoxin AbrB/MazE fold protein
MSLVIEATFQDGAFKPDQSIPYPSGQRDALK